MSTVDALLDSPQAAIISDRLRQALDAEAEERARFREHVAPHHRAEFINGQIIYHMSARDAHNAAVIRIAQLLNLFAASRGLGIVRAESALMGTTRNDYLPDVAFWPAGSGIEEGTTVYPPAGLCVEVLSRSTAKRDRGLKREDYAAHGVAEYWIVDVDARTVEQHLLGEPEGDGAGTYALAARRAEGEAVECVAIDGLAFPVAAAFDDAANVAAVRDLLG